MCLIGSQGEFVPEPSVSILSCQDSVLPDQVERPVCPDSQIAQISVCKCAFGNPGILVYAYISIALRVMLAYIQLVAVWIISVYIGCITQDCSAPAVRTFDCFFLRFHYLTPIKQKWHALACTCSRILRIQQYFIVNQAFSGAFSKDFCPNSYQNGVNPHFFNTLKYIGDINKWRHLLNTQCLHIILSRHINKKGSSLRTLKCRNCSPLTIHRAPLSSPIRWSDKWTQWYR